MSTQYKNAFSKGVAALVESAKDGTEGVRDQIVSALVMLSQKDFGVVLDNMCRYLKDNNHKSTPTHQRITLLIAIKRVAAKHDDAIGDELMKNLAEVCHTDMVFGMDVTSAWQIQACDTVAELMSISPSICVPFVASHIPGTSLPNYFVMSALSKAAIVNPHRFLPHLKDCMAKMLPILGMAKQENARYIMADALASMGETILQVYSEGTVDPVPTGADDALLGGGAQERSLDTPRSGLAKKFSLDDFNETMNTALAIIVNDWSNAKELKVRTTVFLAMGRLAGVVSKDRLEERLPAIVKLLPAAVKKEKPRDVLLPLKGMTAFIRGCVKNLPDQLLPHMESVWQSVFAQLVIYTGLGPADQAELMRVQQEALRSVEALCLGCSQTILNFLQAILDPKFGSKDVVTRCAALGVIRHMIQTPRLESLLEPLKNNVVAIVKTCLEDTDYRTCKAVVQTVMTMGAAATNNYLACEGAEQLLQYVVMNACIPPDVCRDWAAKNKKLAESGTYPTPDEVKQVSISVLQVFHSQFTHLDTVQWPFILEVLGMMPRKPQLFYVFPTICQAIISVSQRLGNTHEFYFDFDSNVNVPKPEALIPLFCVMMSQAQHAGVEETEAIIRSMECISPLLDEPMKKGNTGETPVGSLWLGLLPDMREYVTSSEFRQEDFEEACHNLLKKTCTAKKEEAWVQSLAQQLGEQLPCFSPNEMPNDLLKERNDYKRVALSMYGLILSKAALKTFVGDSLRLLADVTDHTSEVQRQGISRGFGAASSAHCDLVLEKLNRMVKKQQGGGGGGGLFGKKAATGTAERDYGELSRATVLLSFGQVAKKANHSLFTSRLETHIVPTILEVLQSPAGKNPANRIAALAGLAMVGASLRKSDTNFNFASKQAVITQIIALMNVDPTQYGVQNDVLACNLLYHGLTALVPILYLKPALEKDAFATIGCCIAAGLCKEWRTADEKDAKKNDALSAFSLLPEKDVQKQVGLLCNAVMENSGDVVKSFVGQGRMLSDFMHDPIAIRRERATKAYVVLLKHFGKTCDALGVTIPLCKISPAAPEAKSPEAPTVPHYLAPPPADPKAKVSPDASLTDTQKGLIATYNLAFGKAKPDKKKDGEKPADDGPPTDLSLGVVIARLLPRLSDVSLKTKTDALDGVSFCAKLSLLTADQHSLPNGVPLDQYQRAIEGLKEVSKGSLEYSDESAVVAVMKEVTQNLALFLRNTRELPNLLESLLLFGLLDPVEEATVGVCCILSGFLKALSGNSDNLSDEEVKLVLKRHIQVLELLAKLPGDTRKDTTRGTLLAIKALAKNRPALIFNELNTHTVPHSEVIVSVIQTLANDTGLAKLIFNHSLDVMLNSQLYNESYASGCTSKGTKLSLTHSVIAACTTVGEVCQTAKGADVAGSGDFKAPLLCAQLLTLSAAHEAPNPMSEEGEKGKKSKDKKADASFVPPAELVTNSLQNFVRVVFPGAYERYEEELWKVLTTDMGFPEAVAMLLLATVHEDHPEGDKDTTSKKKRMKVKTIEEGKGKMALPPTTSCVLVTDIFKFINEYISKTYDSQRRCALVILGHMLYHVLHDADLFKGIINALLSRSGQDEQYIIKLQATKGFRHLPAHNYEGVRLYVAPVISSLVGCCGDTSPDVVLSAMRTLESMIFRMDCKNEISAVTVNICLKTKSAIDSPDPRIRSAGASLFRVMCDLTVEGIIDTPTIEPNVFTHLTSVLCHMYDTDASVVRECTACLHAIVRFFQATPPSKKASDQLRRLFELDHMQIDGSLKYEEFAHDFSKIFMKHYAARSNDLLVALVAYYQSTFAEVRTASAMFTGFLLKFLSDSDQGRSSLESATQGLIALVKKDPCDETRVKASKAIGHLGDMA
eukprot:TRINITY_DN23031_c0_g3_i1.p1 TRINITY_DN23031_c0_g3~~TRINITY_DN23031_c0_g3_i1.p1  ORF type:complete len:1866 (+),score=924.21 TRINITY_DN23031_c0_g3_i1:206-5803(+)